MMNSWRAYTGLALDVDLSNQTCVRSDLDEALVGAFMGGKGFGAKILYEQLSPGIDPLSPENILVFATGPLTGTLAPASGRYELCTKSPATGLWLDSNCGGFFGPELKFAGYDMVIIRGKADHPVLLTIDNENVELKSAKDIWGLDTITTHRWIREKLGKDYRVACIGPAGEKCVRYAAVISEYRALGRGGAGAVMGSKNLKAIAVRGSQSIAIADPDRFMKTCREAFNELANHPDTGGGRPKYGTNVILSAMDAAGLHPVRNFQKVKFDKASALNEETIAQLYTRNKACFGCPIYCSKISEVHTGRYKGSFTAISGSLSISVMRMPLSGPFI
jgi:aldehyde:ferredoxin oxidoreductase